MPNIICADRNSIFIPPTKIFLLVAHFCRRLPFSCYDLNQLILHRRHPSHSAIFSDSRNKSWNGGEIWFVYLFLFLSTFTSYLSSEAQNSAVTRLEWNTSAAITHRVSLVLAKQWNTRRSTSHGQAPPLLSLSLLSGKQLSLYPTSDSTGTRSKLEEEQRDQHCHVPSFSQTPTPHSLKVLLAICDPVFAGVSITARANSKVAVLTNYRGMGEKHRLQLRHWDLLSQLWCCYLKYILFGDFCVKYSIANPESFTCLWHDLALAHTLQTSGWKRCVSLLATIP